MTLPPPLPLTSSWSRDPRCPAPALFGVPTELETHAGDLIAGGLDALIAHHHGATPQKGVEVEGVGGAAAPPGAPALNDGSPLSPAGPAGALREEVFSMLDADDLLAEFTGVVSPPRDPNPLPVLEKDADAVDAHPSELVTLESLLHGDHDFLNH